MSETQVSEGRSIGSQAEIKTSSLPPLFLHIGRGKSGSSTIQSLASEYVDFMNAMGIACPLTAHGLANHARLAAALQNPRSDLETIEKFRKDVRRNKRRKVFVSAEALFSLKTSGMERLKRHAGGREIRLLGYVRDYPSWLQSIYGQRTKRAVNVEDFDAYYKAKRPRISVLPALERWAEVFGWEAMHIRPLLPEALADGDLVADVLKVLGVNALPPDVETRNVSPHWMSLELQRALAAAAKSKSVAFDLRTAKRTRQLFEMCTSGVKPNRIQYLTKDQWLDLAELYRADMEILGRHLGQSFPVNLTTPPERPFLPDVSRVPEKVKSEVLKIMDKGRNVSRIAPALSELLREILCQKASE